MLPPSANSGPLSDVFKARVTSLIQEQLKPIVTELAAQQQTLLTHLALLRHNHNVNDYQTTRLENIRDLEQSVNFKVSGVLGFDPWQHPTMGTNLREPVPADPRATPQFTAIDQATRAQRAAESAALVKEAGMSARQIGVPLTLQDFPDNPAMNKGGKKEDPMHASIPLFGLRAPRWRAMQGLEDHRIPGTAAYDGVVVPPVDKAGLQLYKNRARQLMAPMWRLIEEGADLVGIGAASSSSSSPGAGASHSGVPGPPEGASPSNKTAVPHTPTPSSLSNPPARRALYRTYAMTNVLEASTSTSNKAPKPTSLRRTSTMINIESSTSTSTKVPTYPSLSRTSTMATIGSTTSEASSLSRASTMATIGSEPPSSRTATTTKTKAKTKQQRASKQRSTRTKVATPAPASSASASTSIAPEQPKRVATLKRGRQAAELDDPTDTNILQPSAEINQEHEDEADSGPTRKRRKSTVASSITSSTTATTRLEGGGRETAAGQGQQPRRSARVTRASAAAGSQPAPRGRATKGKKGNKRS